MNVFENKLITLAPMAGVGDYAFRRICKKYGADFVTTEMVCPKAVCYGDVFTYELARIRKDESPCALQIFASEEEFIEKGLTLLLEKAEIMPAAIDINMGCPVNKIVKSGCGSALMRDLDKAKEVMVATRKVAENVNLPFTVKMRSGWDKDHINAVELAKIAEDCGAKSVCVHARTREQMYQKGIDLSIIADVKNAVKIPVIGNGDIFSIEDAEQMLEQTGCDGVAIARGALGNPFLFAEIKAKQNSTFYAPPDKRERIAVALEQVRIALTDKNEKTVLLQARRHLAYYTKGLAASAKLRVEINRLTTYEQAKALFDAYFAGNF